ncbi:MAG: hypothetical protein J7M25_12070 [Deltaproteobacteria bacterium]|nr:hypothetical protein [Deltaproteobacteria bacterium]
MARTPTIPSYREFDPTLCRPRPSKGKERYGRRKLVPPSTLIATLSLWVIVLSVWSATGCNHQSTKNPDAGVSDAGVSDSSILDGANLDAALPGTPVVQERIDNLTDQEQTNLPVTLSEVFAKGEVTQSVVVTLDNGAHPLVTQVDVKRRWDDGSIKQALLSTVLPELPASGSMAFTIARAESAPDNVGQDASMLADIDGFSPEVTFTTSDGVYTASLKDFLNRNLLARTWLAGPVVDEWHIEGAPKNETDQEHQQLRVSFRIRRYAAMPNSLRVEVVVDNVWTDARGDVDYDLSVTIDGADPIDEKTGVKHYHNARWRKVWWWGPAPADINHVYDRDHLVSTDLIPRYDTSIVVDQTVIDKQYDDLQSSPHDILENGIITAYFPTTGGRDDIGPYPAWAARYLISMDPKARDITLTLGDLAGSFSIHLLERHTGRIVSIDDRPQCNPWGDQRYADKDSVLPDPVGETTSPYHPDNAHQPSLAYVPYLVTGEYYYLEEIYYWASYVLLASWYVPRQDDLGLLVGNQVRGQAWALRELADAAAIGPEDRPETAYFKSKVINNTQYYADTMQGPPAANPMGWWGRQSNWGQDGGRPDSNMADDVRYYTSPWMSDFLIWSFDHAALLGFDQAATCRDWLLAYTIGRFTNGPDFNPYDGAAYHLAVETTEEVQFADWATVWQESFAGRQDPPPTELPYKSCALCYPFIARAVLTAGVRNNDAKAQQAFDFLNSNLDLTALAGDPKWALVP